MDPSTPPRAQSPGISNPGFLSNLSNAPCACVESSCLYVYGYPTCAHIWFRNPFVEIEAGWIFEKSRESRDSIRGCPGEFSA
eukprot:115490-Amorphochlora_amoeboformis.AAC.1